MSSWQNFYMIIGTAAATLTGLIFVATTLIAGIETHVSTLNAGISAFNAPTVVHFCVVLLLAGIFAAFALPANPALALYIVNAAMLVLLFLGIHNAWDLVTFLAVERSHSENKSQAEGRDGVRAIQTTRRSNKKATK